MRRLLLLLCLVVVPQAFAQQTITAAEYFIGTDPGEGLATAISVPAPAASVPLAWTIPTGSLPPNLYRIMLRVQDNLGRWSKPHAHYLIVSPFNEVPLLCTQFEWAVDNGAFTVVDVTDASSVSISQLLSTVALAPGTLHRVLIRVTDNTSRTGAAHAGYFVIAPVGETPRLITQFEYAVDGGAPTLVDIPDASPASLAQTISTIGLSPGTLHSIKFRVTDDQGRVSQFTNTLLPIAPVGGISNNITSYEYWVDGDAPTLVDNPDAPLVNISELIATNSLDVGLHYINIRTTDDLGRTGKEHRTAFIVMSPYQNSLPRTITAAEVFTDPDPGVGNGIAIPLPVDGVWDENSEEASHAFTGWPVGFRRIGVRLRDNLDRWSAAEYDSVLVGPLLVVHRSGDDVVLDWVLAPDIDMYYIERATSVNGTYSVIDSTTATTYSDLGAVPAADKYFYQVRFRDDIIHLDQPRGNHALR